MIVEHIAESRHDQDLFMVLIGISRQRLCSGHPVYLMRCEIESVLRLSKTNDGLGIDWEEVIPRMRIASNETDANKQWWKDYDTSRDNELWWCNVHQRKATYYLVNKAPRCDPKLGGIMFPCQCVNLTGIAEIVEEP